MKRLKELRVKAGMSQQELSEKLNISQQRISKLEKEEVVATEDIILRVSRYFNVSADYLLNEDYCTEINEQVFYNTDHAQEQLDEIIQEATLDEKIKYLNVLKALIHTKRAL